MKKIFILLITLFCTLFGMSQTVIETVKSEKLYNSNNFSKIEISKQNFNIPTTVQYKVDKAQIKIDLQSLSNNNFTSLYKDNSLKIEFSLFLKKGDEVLEKVENKELVLTETTPETRYVYDFKDIFEEVTSIEIKELAIKNESTISVDPRILNDIEAKISYHIHYKTDVRLANESTAKGITEVKMTEYDNRRQVKFQWIPSFDAPYYEFQLLRLDEVSSLDKDDAVTDASFYTDLNWNKALTIEIHDLQQKESIENKEYHYLELTLIEYGYYIWRVRPIGNFYGKEGEYAFGDGRNFGSWSLTNFFNENSGLKLVSPAMLDLPYFFKFEDPDIDKNYAYQRIMTEEGKLHESLAFSDGLLRLKQSQTYLSSNEGDKKISLHQSIYDYSGRASMQLIPVPVKGNDLSGKLNTYLSDQVLNEAEEVYTADDFDVNEGNSNYKDPSVVTGEAYEYYNKPIAKERVASTEGYPFTRTILLNDGTDRPIIQSGVGEDFKLGNTNNTEVTYIYSQPSNYELIRIFGEEALPKEAVLKVITKDPDGTTSVTYTTNEGTTIATALVFKNVKDFEKYNEDNGVVTPTSSDIIEKIEENETSKRGIEEELSFTDEEKLSFVNPDGTTYTPTFNIVSTSQKDVVFEELSNGVKIDYILNSDVITIGCSTYEYANSCKATVRILIQDVEGNLVGTISPKTLNIAMGYKYSITLTNDKDPLKEDEFKITWEDDTKTITSGKQYKIVKILYVLKKEDSSLSGSTNQRTDVLKKVVKVVGTWLALSTTESSMIDFYASTYNFSKKLDKHISDNCEEGAPKENVLNFTVLGDERIYNGEEKSHCNGGFSSGSEYFELFPTSDVNFESNGCDNIEYLIDLNPDEYCVLNHIGFYNLEEDSKPIKYSDGFVKREDLMVENITQPNFFKVTTVCCGDISLPLGKIPVTMCPDKFDDDDDKRILEMEGVASKFVNYLERNLINNEEINPASLGENQVTWETFSPGYAKNTMERMFFHMLYDKYSTVNSTQSAESIQEQYTCQQIWSGLQGTTVAYEDMKQQYVNLAAVDVRDPADNDDASQSNQDKEINDAFGNSIMAWFIKTFIFDDEETMSSNVSNSLVIPFEYDFIGQFLNTVGYKYARIITSESPSSMTAQLINNPPLDSDLCDDYTKCNELDNYYESYDKDGVLTAKIDDKNVGYSNPVIKSEWLYSRNPVYRFKYVEYGNSTAKRIFGIEASFCFLDYENLLKTSTNDDSEFCIPFCENKGNYTTWSSQEIATFMKVVEASQNDSFKEKSLGEYPGPLKVADVSKKELVKLASDKILDCKSSCEDRRPMIRLKVMKEFEDNCYEVVECNDGSNDDFVTMDQIEELVDDIIQNCQEECSGLIKNSEKDPINDNNGTCHSMNSNTNGFTYTNTDEIDDNDKFPCIQVISSCYSMEYGQYDLNFKSHTDQLRPYIFSIPQQETYERLKGWDIEFSLEGIHKKCGEELPCWLDSNQECPGIYSEVQEVSSVED